MSNYTYTIQAGAANVAPNFERINLARADFVANDRCAAGVNGRVAAGSTLTFKIHGYINESSGVLMDSTAGSPFSFADATATVVVEADTNPWNAAPRAIGPTSAFDGFFMPEGTSFFADAFQLGNFIFRNLVIEGAINGDSTNSILAVTNIGTGTAHLFQNLIIRSTGLNGACLRARKNDIVRNCALILTGTVSVTGLRSTGDTQSPLIEQCTIVALNSNSTGIGVEIGNDPPPTMKNCYVGGFNTLFGAGTYPGGTTGNASSGTTVGANAINSVALSTVNFENVTPGSEDLRVKAASVLKTTGATRLASTLTDVFGTSRSDPATIGAFEQGGGGGGGTFGRPYYNRPSGGLNV